MTQNSTSTIIPPSTITEIDTVYISGPMTGLPDYNREAFNAAEQWLAENIGGEVLNPARHPDGWDYGEYMRRAYLDLCQATAVVLLPGWEKSRGALAEVAAAGIMGLPVVMLESVVKTANDLAMLRIFEGAGVKSVAQAWREHSPIDGLASCPFCGARAEEAKADDGGQYVRCTGCNSATALFYPCKEPVDAKLCEVWNRRI